MSLELLTILDPDGKAQKGKDPNLPAAELQKLYRLMVATRLLDDRGLAMQRQGDLAFEAAPDLERRPGAVRPR